MNGLLEALDYGIENSVELLAQHDVNLGRSIARNRALAESLEMEIACMRHWHGQLAKMAKGKNL